MTLDPGVLEGFSGFAQPGWLLLLVPLGVWAALRAWRRRPDAFAWPALAEAKAAGGMGTDPLRVLAFGLRALALVAICAVLLRPMGNERELRLQHDGLDMVLALDASGSMRALDAQVDGRHRTRLELAREVVARFALRRVGEGDRVGLVVFGESAFTQCPLTSDGGLLDAALGRIEAGMAGEATALGDALALAVKRVGATPPADAPSDAPLAGRLVVLLTDGRSNAGAIPSDVAAALAAQRGVRVHTVGIGGRGEVAMARSATQRAGAMERHDLDSVTLQRIADATGGRSFLAQRSEDLAAVYDEIDRLERVPRDLPPRRLAAPVPEPFLWLAFGVVAVELLLSRVALRRIP